MTETPGQRHAARQRRGPSPWQQDARERYETRNLGASARQRKRARHGLNHPGRLNRKAAGIAARMQQGQTVGRASWRWLRRYRGGEL